GLGRGRGAGCSLTYASRCLHNVLFLCASHAKAEREFASLKAGGMLSSVGRPGVLGMSARSTLVPKNPSSSLANTNNADGGAGTGAGVGAASSSGGQGGAGAGPGGEAQDEEEGKPLDGSDEEVFQVALVDLAYVHLALNDPVATLDYSNRLLTIRTNTPSAVNRHLAHVYAAEALCLLGRPSEALEHLLPLLEDTTTVAGGGGESSRASGGNGGTLGAGR
ncbi:unnamed protein product, partial [Discosporangium mesarthrocarpum]